MSNTLLVAGLGATEIIVILAIVLLLFGGKKIPELMRGLGKGVKEFKDGKDGLDGETPTTTTQKDQDKIV
ncbi:MAG: twin-arginine translocase TatA/TatE family subunit [Pedobacter sp.]|nr:MAG: twin-arginine translocase TatA/TatE family subunit [Pedobacter sp.]